MDDFKLPKLELFSNLNIFLDESIPSSLNFNLRKKLIKRGANIVNTVEIDKNKILNYYITIDFNHDIKSIPNFNFVTPSWVDISIKTNIVQNPIFFNPDISMFFSGIVATAVGIDERDCKEIYLSIETFGGQWTPTYKKGVTHVITLFDSVKVKNIDQDVKIILPHWFEDCVKLKRKIPDEIYLHPNPELLQFSTKDINELKSKKSQSIIMEPSYPFLEHKKFYIDPDIREANDFERYSIHLKKSGVKILKDENIDQADFIILKNKNNINYLKEKSIINIPIVTEFWLHDVLKQQRIIRPYSKLCYSFLEFLDLPKMENYIITITNYHGQARKYIIQLIYALGAKFTSNMTTENTHIICGECSGKKYEKAVEWNIEIVNHIWLEECYRNRCVQAITKPIYTYYPPQLNNIVGNIFVEWNDHQHIVYLFQQGLTSTTSSSTALPSNVINEEVSRQLNDIHIIDNRSSPPSIKKNYIMKKDSLIKREEDTTKDSPQLFKTIKPTISEDQTTEIISPDTNSLVNTPLSKKSKLSQAITLQEGHHDSSIPPPLQEHQSKPVLTKAPASSKKESVEGKSQPLMQRDLDHNPLVKPLKKRKDTNNPLTDTNPPKRIKKLESNPRIPLNPHHNNENDNKNTRKESSKDTIPLQKTPPKDFSSIPTSTDKLFNIMFTGTKPTEQDIKKIKALGGNIVKNINNCTHLLAKKIAKTEKFLMGISLCKHVIHYDWLSSSYTAGRMLDESYFPLKDRLNEKEFAFSLEESLNRSRQKKLLENLTFIITVNVFPSRTVLSRIITSAGGKIILEEKSRDIKNFSKDYIIISSVQDKNLWNLYISSGYKIYNVEFLLIGILRQCLTFKNKTFILAEP